ncbi:class I SAM-dependent methyltransferase [Amycolatopsis magusensis]|uniref:class I SAM-dependent methyltransferase n=1 Tax=Amycolatopsis magusensis TaxID=882444 RepID=UPI0037926E31
MFDYDAELRRYQRRLSAALDIGAEDRVLDIGCGGGQTTRTAAGLASAGSALGVDTSPAMVAHARRLAAAERLGNVRFEQADAQVHPFPPGGFTLGMSRFGTMFFTDPVRAFTNIGRALRPGARLVQLVWQAGDRQEWVAEIHRALGSEPPANDAGAFSLGDPAKVEAVLTAAGFTDVHLIDLDEPVFYGADPEAAVEAVLVLRMAADPLRHLDPVEAERVRDRLRSTMAAHLRAGGVWFDSRAWLVTARRTADS